MVSVDKYCEGVESIYVEKPAYKLGHDGSDGYCDCIGMCRGAGYRAGQQNISKMSGTNQAARFTLKNLHPISSSSELKRGQVVLKTKPMDDPDMPLPDRYRPGNVDYTGDLTNYSHIGSVTRTTPLEITHMTSPSAKKDDKLGNWKYVADLPWVDYEGGGDEPTMTATVYADNGKPVKMRAKPSTDCKTFWEIPVGTIVNVLEKGSEWCKIAWREQYGYMMTRFLQFHDEPEPGPEPTGDVIVSRTELQEVYNKIGKWLEGLG